MNRKHLFGIIILFWILGLTASCEKNKNSGSKYFADFKVHNQTEIDLYELGAYHFSSEDQKIISIEVSKPGEVLGKDKFSKVKKSTTDSLKLAFRIKEKGNMWVTPFPYKLVKGGENILVVADTLIVTTKNRNFYRLKTVIDGEWDK